MLTDELVLLERRLRTAGARITSFLGPPLPRATVEAGLVEIGLAPGEEVIAWYGWHNGLVGYSADEPARTEDLVPDGQLRSFEEMCSRYVELRETARIIVETAPAPYPLSIDDFWEPNWFPVLRLFGKGYLAAECDERNLAVSRVHVVWNDDTPDERQPPAFRSLAEFVHWYDQALSGGRYHVDDEGCIGGPGIGELGWPFGDPAGIP